MDGCGRPVQRQPASKSYIPPPRRGRAEPFPPPTSTLALSLSTRPAHCVSRLPPSPPLLHQLPDQAAVSLAEIRPPAVSPDWMSVYDSDDALRRSPPLQAIRPKHTPSPSPPPFLNRPDLTTNRERSKPGKRRSKPGHRSKAQPTLADSVLLNNLGDFRYPDTARKGATISIAPESSDENTDFEESMPENRQIKPGAITTSNPLNNTTMTDDLTAVAKKTLSLVEDGSSPPHTHSRNPSASLDSAARQQDGEQMHVDGDSRSTSQFPIRQPKSESTGSAGQALLTPLSEKYKTPTNPESEVTSPLTAEYYIPDADAPSEQKLPALKNPTSPRQENGAGSPGKVTSLPSIGKLVDLAETANNENEARANANGTFSHRGSISGPVPVTSPTMINRPFANGHQRSPPGQFPPITSPISTQGGETPQSAYPKAFSPSSSSTKYPISVHLQSPIILTLTPFGATTLTCCLNL